MTTRWCYILVLAFLFSFAGNSWADEVSIQEEINALKERIEQLERQLEKQPTKQDQQEEVAEKAKEGSYGPPHDKNPLPELLRKISIGGVLAGAYQYQDIRDGELEEDFDDKGRGALPFQPEISFTPTDRDEIFVKLGFAAGNGINDETPFALAPWAADLEDDVKDINGRNRDYLLTAWYKHSFDFGEEQTVALTGGVIDATDYLDENAYSNDEYTQFMNEALVNGPNAFLPSYDVGGAVEWGYQNFSLKGVYMNVGENDDGNNYNFFGAQLGYHVNTPLGEGNYRLLANYCSDDFLDPTGTSKESRQCMFVSFDQGLGDLLGAWIRLGLQDDDAAITFEKIFSGGIHISGKLWGREEDNIGIGYGYLDGGNLEIDYTSVAEAYVRFVLNEFFALTMDVQYEKDNYVSSSGEDLSGFTYGVRGVVEF
jgi:porin